MKSRSDKQMPSWAWAASLLLLPAGVFIVLGCGKVISWTRALILAVVSQGSVVGFVALMGWLEQRNASPLVRSTATASGVVLIVGWGCVIYLLGRREAYWTPSTERSWRVAAWVSGIMLLLAGLAVGFQIVLSIQQV